MPDQPPCEPQLDPVSEEPPESGAARKERKSYPRPPQPETALREALVGSDLPADLAARIRQHGPDSCPCVRVHSPAPTRVVPHYILPLAWGGRPEPANVVYLCGTAYLAITDLLAWIQTHGPLVPVPSRDVPHFARRLALAAIYRYRRLHSVGWPTETIAVALAGLPSVASYPDDSGAAYGPPAPPAPEAPVEDPEGALNGAT